MRETERMCERMKSVMQKEQRMVAVKMNITGFQRNIVHYLHIG